MAQVPALGYSVYDILSLPKTHRLRKNAKRVWNEQHTPRPVTLLRDKNQGLAGFLRRTRGSRTRLIPTPSLGDVIQIPKVGGLYHLYTRRAA
jgi:hypothetical protein